VKFLETDITVVEQVQNAVKQTIEWTKETGAILGGVINCAGMAKNEFFLSSKRVPHSVSTFDQIMAINVSGTFHLSRIAAEHLATVQPEDTPDAERGVIIMVSSEAAFEGQPSQSVYAASKGAISSLTLPMARELARHHIRVVSIAPGPFTTPMTGLMSDRVTKAIHRVGLLYPRRFGKPQEFAKTVSWIIQCTYVNGETVRLNGGGHVPAML